MTADKDISEMIARHARLGDAGSWEEWSSDFAEDAVLKVSDSTIIGRQAIVDSVRTRGEEHRGRHFLGPSTVAVDGDTAEAVTDSLYVQPTLEQDLAITGAARYRDKLRRSEDGRWRYLSRAVDQLGASAPSKS